MGLGAIVAGLWKVQRLNPIHRPRPRAVGLNDWVSLWLALAVFVVAPVLTAYWWFFPGIDFSLWERGAPPVVWSYRLSQEEFYKDAKPAVRTQFHYVPLQAISQDVRFAVLVGEDVGFFNHGAIDVDEMRFAVENWLLHGKRLRGASTLTQQLAKNLFLTNQRSFWRKFEELRDAWWLERTLSKRRILELYLNVSEFGPGIYGVDAAARAYFQSTAAALGPEQAAGLAATLPAPTHANPSEPTRAWKFRRSVVMDRMREFGHLRLVVGRR